jgi:hypothetical protein
MADKPDASDNAPAYLKDNISEFLTAPMPRIAAITWRKWMEPYFDLEEHELRIRLAAQRELSQAIWVWLQHLKLFKGGLHHSFERGNMNREQWQALVYRLDLLSLAADNSKYALDGVLGGHYSGSLAISRHLFDSWRRIIYARLEHSDIWRWFPREHWPEGVLPKPEGIMPTKPPDADDISKLVERRGDDADKLRLESAGKLIKYLNNHAHPTPEGATQSWDPSDPGVRRTYPSGYSETHAGIGITCGLYANDLLLHELGKVATQREEWRHDLAEAGNAFRKLRFRWLKLLVDIHESELPNEQESSQTRLKTENNSECESR